MNRPSEPTRMEISTKLGTYKRQVSGRYCRDNVVAIIKKRSVYMPMLIAIDNISIGTNDVLNFFEIISSGATAQNSIISQ